MFATLLRRKNVRRIAPPPRAAREGSAGRRRATAHVAATAAANPQAGEGWWPVADRMAAGTDRQSGWGGLTRWWVTFPSQNSAGSASANGRRTAAAAAAPSSASRRPTLPVLQTEATQRRPYCLTETTQASDRPRARPRPEASAHPPS